MGYGWIITNANPNLKEDIGTAGPRNIPQETLNAVSRGEGVEFKMYDDDGEWYYTGRIIGDYEGLEPLDDFGGPNAGCTEIRINGVRI